MSATTSAGASRHSARHASAGASALELLLVTVIGVAFTSIFAVALGKGVGWDQKNYQYYNVYAWLSGRMFDHIAPAGTHTWLNPLLYVPHYWAIRHLRPVIAGALFGAWAGLNFTLVYALARALLRGLSRCTSIVLSFLCAAVGISDPSLLSLLGTSESADTIVSLLVLAALLLLCRDADERTSRDSSSRGRPFTYLLAGALLGAAAGLKWTCFVYVVGMTFALAVLWKVLRLDARRFSAYAAGGISGFLLTGGYWSWLLWRNYSNPFFPYWNRYFRSPWGLISNYRDIRFLPRTFEAAVAYPFDWLVGVHTTSEDPFRDARFALLAIFVPVALVCAAAQRLTARRGEQQTLPHAPLLAPAAAWLLLAFSVFSYIAWLQVFAIQRYLVPLALITGLVLLAAFDFFLPHRQSKIAVFVLLSCLSVLWTRAALSGWRIPYGSDWFGVQVPTALNEPGTMFIMLGGGPMGYVVPFLPQDSRTVRLLTSTMPQSETALVQQARDAISHHRGPLRSLSSMPLTTDDLALLPRFGIGIDPTTCIQFPAATDTFTSCRIAKLSPDR